MSHSIKTTSDNVRGAAPSKLELLGKLREQASVFANSLEAGAQAAITEKEQMESEPSRPQDRHRLAFLRREREAALWAPMRLDIYQLELLRHPPFCPYCWMLEGKRVALEPMLEADDAMTCAVCGNAY